MVSWVQRPALPIRVPRSQSHKTQEEGRGGCLSHQKRRGRAAPDQLYGRYSPLAPYRKYLSARKRHLTQKLNLTSAYRSGPQLSCLRRSYGKHGCGVVGMCCVRLWRARRRLLDESGTGHIPPPKAEPAVAFHDRACPKYLMIDGSQGFAGGSFTPLGTAAVCRNAMPFSFHRSTIAHTPYGE